MSLVLFLFKSVINYFSCSRRCHQCFPILGCVISVVIFSDYVFSVIYIKVYCPNYDTLAVGETIIVCNVWLVSIIKA